MTDYNYNTDHLTTDEVKQVVKAVWNDIQDKVAKGQVSEELGDEYDFWSEVLEKRMNYDDTGSQAQDY